ncbi:SulP family inorganic anion transporter [Pseudonocardia bannensis]|uniref:Sulfate permease n=1 Tax=Pseudonocardia bannensis TaxID=630973 RepID=A0A848DF10_9PSEU|nr:sulfate permease [Pseudonocardia bannensis]NMH91210.1 sulfate permease [Pseudonocardia bannensis]
MTRPSFGTALRPGLAALHRRDGPALRGDLLAGLTVAAYLVPQVLAYAELAGLAPAVGLWAVVTALVVYAVLGSSPQLSVGPESTTALMTAVAIAPLAGADPGRYAALAAGLALMVGGICLLGRVARLGFLADLLSRPVLVGYLTGIALIMIVSQLENMTGVPVEGSTFPPDLASFATHLGSVHLPTVLLGTSVLAFLLVGSRLLPRAPIPLLGVLLATAAVGALALSRYGIETVGPVPAGLPRPALPALGPDDLAQLILPAIGVAIVGYSDNVLTGRAFATHHRENIDADQEMLALGAANVVVGLFHGFPVSSSGSRTVIGDALGSRSQLYSLVALVAVLAVLLVGGPVLAAFPTAALGALVIYAALRLIELGEFRRIARFRRTELALALATTAAVISLGVLYGVLAAVALSILDLLRRVSRPHDGILGFAPGLAGMHDIDDYPDATVVPGLVVYRYDAPLCFANAENFHRRALAALDDAPSAPSWLLLNVEAFTDVDLTATDMLHQLHDELARRRIVLALARVKQELRASLQASGLLTRIGEDRIFPTLPTAVQAFHAEHGPPGSAGLSRSAG